MTEQKFRSQHSKAIEYYQYIEMRLKGICAVIMEDGDRSWYARLDDYDSDPLGKLLITIKTIQSEKKIALFSPADLTTLDAIRQSRNYWVHQCFTDYEHPIIFKKGSLRDDFAQRINKDLNDAYEWDKRLTEIHRSLKPTPPTI